jgi:hypothetical protein
VCCLMVSSVDVKLHARLAYRRRGNGGNADTAVLWLVEDSCSCGAQGDFVGLQLGLECWDLPSPRCLLLQHNWRTVDGDVEPYAADGCSLQIIRYTST